MNTRKFFEKKTSGNPEGVGRFYSGIPYNPGDFLYPNLYPSPPNCELYGGDYSGNAECPCFECLCRRQGRARRPRFDKFGGKPGARAFSSARAEPRRPKNPDLHPMQIFQMQQTSRPLKTFEPPFCRTPNGPPGRNVEEPGFKRVKTEPPGLDQIGPFEPMKSARFNSVNFSKLSEDQGLRKPSSKEANPMSLDHLEEFLLAFINGLEITRVSWDDLSGFEKQVLRKILDKKQYNEAEEYVASMGRKGRVPRNREWQITSFKRKEEALKFVFRAVSKEIEQLFIERALKVPRSRCSLEEGVYGSYFRGFFGDGPRQAQRFAIPLNQDPPRARSSKTLNKAYFGLVNLSDAFMNDVNAGLLDVICWTLPLNGGLYRPGPDLHPLGRLLLESLLAHGPANLKMKVSAWAGSLRSLASPDRALQRLADHIRKNSFKFPWTLWEVKSAFVTSLLALNEAKLSAYSHPKKTPSLEGDELSFYNSFRKLGRVRHLTTKKRVKMLADQEKFFRSPLNPCHFYWLGIVNQPQIRRLCFTGLPSERPPARTNYLSKEAFFNKMRGIQRFRFQSRPLEVHLLTILVNLWAGADPARRRNSDSAFFSFGQFVKASKSILLQCAPHLLNVFEKCFETRRFFERTREVCLLLRRPDLLSPLEALGFVANATSLQAGVKHNSSVSKMTSFITRHYHRPPRSRALKLLLKALFLRKVSPASEV